MPAHPHDERRHRGEKASVLCKFRLLGRIDRKKDVGDLESDRVTLEEVWEIDEILAAFGVGVCDQLVVGKRQAENVRVDDDGGTRVGAVANHIGVEAVDKFFFALGRALMDGALATQS